MPAPRPLPDTPDLDQLRRQAKDLLRAARAADPGALSRFRSLPTYARVADDALSRAPLALHDAQSVIAREHGFPSWNALRERVEELTLGHDAAVREFVEAATDGRGARAERLLALHPRLADASFHAALVLGDAAAVEAHLARRPVLARETAREAGGPRGWEPLHYVCHTALGRRATDAGDGLVAVARQLLALGADPNLRFPWLHHGVRRPVLWGATRVVQVPRLAELLLSAGADPDDGVTLPLAASAGDLVTLELLRAHGASPDQPWATDGASTLYAILQWSTTAVGVHWLLAHGAAPDPVFASNGETPMHAVARRWDADLAERLAARGADPTRPRADGRSPYAVAALEGNRAVADWLRARGAADELQPVDRLVAACAGGDRATVEALLASRPSLRGELAEEHYSALHRAAERGDLAALALLLDCGFDPNRGDAEIGKTALHSAAHEGQVDAVRLLLARGASPAARDREFRGQPLVWAADGARMHPDRAPDFAAVARLLLDAGSPDTWEPGDEPADVILEILADWRRAQSASTSASTTEVA
ncbi:MAG: ankyrin repeat domain-containing protein [Gemmatirosa sp.]|nr:ankyrin repeat domain-containing protein [Gemmatirosa sp.]